MILRREPAARAVAVDLPDVVPATRRAASGAGVVDRVEVVEGDLFAGALDDDLAGHLVPGGRLAIVDALPSQVTTDPRLALYALGLSLRTATGGLHRRGDYRQWLQAADLDDVEVHPTTDGVAVVVGGRGSRPARTVGAGGAP